MDSVFREPFMIGGVALPAEALVAIYLDEICVFSECIDQMSCVYVGS
jgi:hypothetical protein